MNLGGVIRLNKTGCTILGLLIFILLIYSLSSKTDQNAKSNLINLGNLLEIAIKASQNGGKEVVDAKDDLKLKSKGLTKEGLQDTVTLGDYLSHCSMVGTVKNFFPNLKIVSEEATTSCQATQQIDFSIDSLDVPTELVDINDVTVWIDPLDATYEYSEKDEKLYHFVTTMVCVAVKGKPVIGVIHKPFNKNTTWAWVGKTTSSDLINPQVSNNESKLKIIISRSHKGEIEKVLSNKFVNQYELVVAAGAGYKALEVAYGHVNSYLHITEIKKWDICAGNAIINAQGGKMTDKIGNEIDYSDDKNVKNQNGLIASLNSHEMFVGKL